MFYISRFYIGTENLLWYQTFINPVQSDDEYIKYLKYITVNFMIVFLGSGIVVPLTYLANNKTLIVTGMERR